MPPKPMSTCEQLDQKLLSMTGGGSSHSHNFVASPVVTLPATASTNTIK